MFDRLRKLLLRVLKVPPEPEPPLGAPGSLRVFRAGRNYYRLRLLGWGVGQVGPLVGIIFSLWFLSQVKTAAEKAHGHQTATTNAAPASVAATNAIANPQPSTSASRRGEKWKGPTRERLARLIAGWPGWVFPLLAFLEFAGLAVYFIQLFLTYAAVRLDYELRWYVVTDRSLRLRSGVWTVQEMTMSYANLQQVMVSQGPIQRLLGIADLRVESAGGGGGGSAHAQQHGQADSLHTGVFHGVEHATEVRDLILARLRSFRETGLGDPDELPATPPTAVAAGPNAVLGAARDLLAEARALRIALRLRG
jgi:membrane protein YdbS with pleckstrin-like domain